MINTTDLYSHNNKFPNPIPFEIILSNGVSRTDPSTFTEEEILDAGFTGPYPQPSYDLEFQRLEWDEDKKEYIIIDLPRPSAEDLSSQRLAEIRVRRTMLLRDSDWTVLPDSPLSEQEKNLWINYRQQLRDLPSNIGDVMSYDDITHINWPQIPSSNVDI